MKGVQLQGPRVDCEVLLERQQYQLAMSELHDQNGIPLLSFIRDEASCFLYFHAWFPSPGLS